MDVEKLRGLLGLAQRGRNLALGRAACRQAGRAGRLALVLVARDAGASAVRDGLAGGEVTCVSVDLDKLELGFLVGRASVAILGILDPHLAAGVQKVLNAPARPTP